ncbi:hypothetical protein [uncultured Agitococcus sp.]|uniref:beta strand repeat-containing protein n=1 Tax=uncultured Agitococcus sp. TaxID=1506599 RepID=UPI0026213816|nr:hypothetical protein [uncultured Agitococcus sp.]
MRTQDNNRQACQNTSKVWRLNAIAGAMAVAIGGFSASAFAAAPAANSLIGNTATATYTDASAINRTATSNTVQTVVQQVRAFDLVANETRYVAPGGQVTFPHTLTNTGNGSDTISLSVANNTGDNFDLTGFVIYADADGNGIPDNATPVTSVTLAAGGVYKFVVVANAPVTAANAQQATTTVTASAAAGGGLLAVSDTNTDTAIISTNAVVTVTKSANILTGPTGTVVEYTLTYTNTGNTAATSLAISDLIPKSATPATVGGMKYQAGSGVWSGGGTLTDDIDTSPNEGTANTADGTGITYQVLGTPSLGTERVVATIASVPANTSGTLKFRVRVDDSTADGNSVAMAGVLSNTATYGYNNGSTNITGQNTNTVNFTVTATASVVANNASGTTADGGANDLVAPTLTVANPDVNQGEVVVFDNWIHNTGNGADTFNVTYANAGVNGFPAGTSFQLYQADGVNVLQDSNSDGIPDTGVLPVGGEYKVVLKATLPAGTSSVPVGGFTVVKTATSVANPGVNNSVNDTLTAITPNVADLSNNTTPTQNLLGAGDNDPTATVPLISAGTEDNSGTPWTTQTTNPGTSVIFPLLIENKRGIADNYDLAAGSTSAMAALPPGWTAVFRLSTSGSCATMGATIINTGTITANDSALATGTDSKLVCAVISVPANAAATPTSPQDIYFKITSPISGASDTKRDAVSVNTVRNLQMTTDRTGQVFPSGTVVYEHTLTNNGNVVEGDALDELLLTGTNSLAGFSTILYIDTNNNGVLDAADAVITGTAGAGNNNFHTVTVGTAGTGLGNGLAGLDIGESVRIFAKVQAPAGATPGTTDSLTVLAQAVGTINSIAAPSATNTDTTNVIGGQIRLDKEQALDAACDGNADAAFTNANINALPGACIMYRIVATNEGVSPVTSVLINDTTPSFTTLFDKVVGGTVTTATTPVVTGGTVNTVPTKPADGAAGALQADVGTLNGTQSATFTFSVKIDQ